MVYSLNDKNSPSRRLSVYNPWLNLSQTKIPLHKEQRKGKTNKKSVYTKIPNIAIYFPQQINLSTQNLLPYTIPSLTYGKTLTQFISK